MTVHALVIHNTPHSEGGFMLSGHVCRSIGVFDKRVDVSDDIPSGSTIGSEVPAALKTG